MRLGEQPEAVVEGGSDLRDRGRVAGQVLDAPEPGLGRLAARHHGDELVARLLARLGGHDLQRALAREVVEAGREPRDPDVDVARHRRDRDRLRGLEEAQLNVEALPGEEARILRQEDGPGTRELEDAELDRLGFGPRPTRHGDRGSGDQPERSASRRPGIPHGRAPPPVEIDPVLRPGPAVCVRRVSRDGNRRDFRGGASPRTSRPVGDRNGSRR